MLHATTRSRILVATLTATLMLVSAFAGHAHVMALYRHAVEARYRFFSYGDAMLLERAPPG